MADNTVEVIINVKNLEESVNGMETFARLITQVSNKNVNFNFNIHGLSQANSGLSQTESTLTRVANTISQITTLASSIPSAISGFASGITNAFSGMAGMFNTNFMDVAYRTVAHSITSSIMSSIPQVIQRYDIMNTFTDYMNLAGVDTETANAALSRVDQSIRGIPIGLDEAAFRLRRYQMYLGDIDRATNLTIGVQNALMAGGASEQMRNTAYTQIDRLLATGKLSQARQWMSLFNGLGVSLRFLKEELALDPTASMQQVASDLASGAIATDDFLHAMERLADNEGLTQALTIYKGTIEAWMANIKNAVKRGGQAIMEAMDDVMTDQFGEGITGVLKTIRDQIDSISQSAANFIRQNPEFVGTLGEIFGGLWQRIQSADFGSFIGKLVDNLGRLGEIVFRIFDNLPDGFLSDFVSFAVTLAGPLSIIFKAVSSGLPLIIGVFERMKDMDFADLIEKIVRQVEIFADVIARVLSLIPDGLLGDLMAFGLVWGKPLASVISSIGGAVSNLLKGLSGAGGTGGFGALGAMLSQPWMAIGMAAAAGIGLVGIAVDNYLRKLQEMRDAFTEDYLSGIFGDAEAVTGAATGSAKASSDLRFNAERNLRELEKQHEVAVNALNTVKELNDAYNNSSVKDRAEAQERLNDALSDYNQIAGTSLELGTLTNEQLALAEAYGELTYAQDRRKAYAQARSDIDNQNIQNEIDLEALELQIQRRKSNIEYLNTQLPGGASYEAYVQELINQGGLLNIRPVSEETQERYGNIYNTREAEKAALEEDLKAESELKQQIEENIALYEIYGNRATEVGEKIQELKMLDFSSLGSEAAFTALDENVQKTVANFEALRDTAAEAIHSIISGFNEVEAVESVSADTILSNLESQTSFLTNFNDNLTEILQFAANNPDLELGGVFTKLGEMSPEDAAQVVGTLADSMKNYVAGSDTNILDSIITETNVVSAAENLATNLFAAVNAYATDPEFLKTLQENGDFFGDGETLVSAIFGSDWQTSAQTMAQNALEPVNEELEATTENAFDAKIEVGNLASAMEARAHSVSNFAGSLSQVAATLLMILRNAQGAARAINGIPTSKHISISYSGLREQGVVVTNPWGQHYASGGYVNGTIVPSMAIGTDNVPALLSNGEFVISKNAVNMFGQTFLEAVNGMDVGAAYDAMMSRVSVPHGSTYNYYDNHATVNQNFYGNTGQGFSQKKAYKFVSAL